jgi:hypothetical protein
MELGWGQTVYLVRWLLVGLLFRAQDDGKWVWIRPWDKNWQEKPTYRHKTSPSATLSTKNPTWSDLGPKPGCRGGKPATHHCPSSGAFGRAPDSRQFGVVSKTRVRAPDTALKDEVVCIVTSFAAQFLLGRDPAWGGTCGAVRGSRTSLSP